MKRRDRLRIINDYLEDAGEDVFVPRAFLEWLSDKPKHECYDLFFSITDAEAAAAYREGLVRQWVSDLRITVNYTDPVPVNIAGLEVREYKLPAMISPVDGRRAGGGYIQTDADDDGHVAELRRQAATALEAWLERYEGIAGIAGVNVSSLHDVVEALGNTE